MIYSPSLNSSQNTRKIGLVSILRILNHIGSTVLLSLIEVFSLFLSFGDESPRFPHCPSTREEALTLSYGFLGVVMVHEFMSMQRGVKKSIGGMHYMVCSLIKSHGAFIFTWFSFVSYDHTIPISIAFLFSLGGI
jgi:hypothetical protein